METITEKKENEIETLKDQSLKPKRISYLFDQWLRKRCVQLETHLEKISAPGKIMILALFSILGVCYNLSVIVSNLYADSELNSHRINSLPVSARVMIQGSSDITHQAPLSKADYDKITKFINALDSLKKSPERVKEYQEFIKAHPGILDSIKLAENLQRLKDRK